MSTSETGKPERTAPQPIRQYDSRGGPFAAGLGEIEVAVLAEIERGGSDDRGTGSKR